VRSAKQLIDTIAVCVTCGREHKPRKIAANQWTWAAKDGHTYRSRLFEITGWSSTGLIEVLRELAKQ